MHKSILLAATLAFAAVAGCSGSPAPTTTSTTQPAVSLDTSWASHAIPTAEHGHSHRDWTQHLNLSTPNMVELAHDPLGIPAFGNATAGGYFCGGEGKTADGRRLTVISSYDTSVAFVLVDNTDPLHPKHLGDYVLDYAQTYDVDITPDGKHVVVAADISPTKQPDPPGVLGMVTLHPSFRNACTGQTVHGPDQTVAAGPSTILVSLADVMHPAFEDLYPAPVLGPHSVSTQIIGGTTYVASSITNLAHQGSYFQFFQLQDLPTGGSKLIQDSLVDAGQYGTPTAVVNGHVDAEIAVHPVTNKPVVYLSDWDGGLIILDFSIPQAPVRLGQWADSGADNGALHSTRSIPGVHDGHHYLLAGQEFVQHPTNRPSGWIYILDDTDPTNIKEVGRWTLPVDTQQDWGGVELYSTHYFRIQNNTVFVAMYHGGVWAFTLDLDHPEAMKAPPTVGVFVPDGGPQNGRKPTGGYDYAPFVLDVFPDANYDLVIYDGLSGVYSVHYDVEHPMTSPAAFVVA
ncbi:MAG: hypothetical protein V4510_03320 [bacterium]